ncbi:substrate-binding domain-containing protein [Cellulomonas sp.]|uniref:substrate-binding domain-containing protein n=1 Tax=Cellulomonas sp. TaxID=40001 RepID=UPI003BAB4F35
MGARTMRTAAVLVAVGLLAAGCAGPEAAQDETQLVGVAMPTTVQERWIGDGENLQAQFASLGYDVDLEYADDDVDTQIAQITAMIDAGADALVVGAVDGSKLRAVLSQAAKAGIAILSYDRLIRDSPDVGYYASFDNWSVGVLQANALLTGLGAIDASGARTAAPGPWAVEIFAGSPDDNNATVFYQGAMSVLQPYLDSGVLVVPSGQTDFATVGTPGWKGETAAARLQTLTGPYLAGLHLDGILAPNDGIAVALLDAARSGLGYGGDGPALPVVPGQDAELASVRSIVAGEQYATVYKDTQQLAEVAVQMVRDLLAGDEPEVNDTTSYDNGVRVVPSYLLAPQLVTLDNYREVLVAGGYYSQDELGTPPAGGSK